jgi:hypothetical protein
MTSGKWAKKARDARPVPDKDLSENECEELVRLREKNAALEYAAIAGWAAGKEHTR